MNPKEYLIRQTPDCCKGCKHHDWDTDDFDGYGRAFDICLRNVFIPYKKQTCKKRQEYDKVKEQ